MSVAIVTGGSGGIGAAICRALADAGAHVLVGYGGNQNAAENVASACPSATALHIDVTDEASVEAAVQTAADHGTLSIVVNNAGVAHDDLLIRLDSERFDATMQTNLRGAYLLSRAALRPMLRGRFGRIISVASVVALRGNAGQTAYAASKAGLIGFTKSLAREVGRKGITANVVAPGFVATAMTDGLPQQARDALIAMAPIGRPVTADEVAATVRFLASEEAGSITGAVVPVDGGAAI
ncbi:MAG: 3-oxoacyl-ACP reductase family protein [Nitriliruptoraceae bacterium]